MKNKFKVLLYMTLVTLDKLILNINFLFSNCLQYQSLTLILLIYTLNILINVHIEHTFILFVIKNVQFTKNRKLFGFILCHG